MTKQDRLKMLKRTCHYLKHREYYNASICRAYIGELNDAEVKLLNTAVDNNDNSGGLVR